jgi:hypothetical protein
MRCLNCALINSTWLTALIRSENYQRHHHWIVLTNSLSVHASHREVQGFAKRLEELGVVKIAHHACLNCYLPSMVIQFHMISKQIIYIMRVGEILKYVDEIKIISHGSKLIPVLFIKIYSKIQNKTEKDFMTPSVRNGVVIIHLMLQILTSHERQRYWMRSKSKRKMFILTNISNWSASFGIWA